jgi:hypothetical protein
MSIFKKSDVKNHLSLRFRAKTYLDAPVSRPDASGYSLAEPVSTGTRPTPFAKDYSAEHTIAIELSTPTANSIESADSPDPEKSKSAQP